jgi:two-component system, NtrC family, response regulator AtoC
VTTRDQVIDVVNLPSELTAPVAAHPPFPINLEHPLPHVLRQATANIEGQYLRKALKKAHGNVARAAKICGLSRRSVTAKIAEYGIDRIAYKRD